MLDGIHPLIHQPIASRFGVSWPYAAAQLASLLFIVACLILAIGATIVSARSFQRTRAFLWILLCWLLPVIGPALALWAAHKQFRASS